VSFQKFEHFIKSSWYWKIPVIAGVATVILMISEINQSLFLILNSVLYIPFEAIWLNISVFGEAEVIAIMLVPFISKRPDIIWAVLITACITIIGVELAKHYFALPRPPVILRYDQFHQIGENYSVDSFPSVQAAVAFSIAAVVILSVQQLWIKITIFSYACLIGLSQIAIGANWPIDIVSGVLAGWLPARVSVDIAKNKLLKTKSAIKFLLMILMLLSFYLFYNLITGDINVAIVKGLILIICFTVAFPEIRKIIKDKVKAKRAKKTKKSV